MSDPNTIRSEMSYRGRVQGVGFRATVLELAGRRPSIHGWVRNEADGSVFLVAEGPRAEVDALIADIERRMTRFIRNIRRDDGPARGEAGFEIRR